MWVTRRSAHLRHRRRHSPAFIRSHPGPNQEFEVFGGQLRIISIEVYDIAVVIRWRASPEPDIARAFPSESAELERDLAGLEDWAADDLRMKAQQRLRMMRLYRFELKDDVGTEYVQRGQQHGGGGGGVMSGEAEFRPAPPPAASTLTFSWLNLRVPVPLRCNQGAIPAPEDHLAIVLRLPPINESGELTVSTVTRVRMTESAVASAPALTDVLHAHDSTNRHLRRLGRPGVLHRPVQRGGRSSAAA